MPTNLYRFRLFAFSLLIAFLGTLSTAHARRASKDSGSSTTVVIDAGHGGHDTGKIHRGGAEVTDGEKWNHR